MFARIIGFLFIKPVRYFALKAMKRFRQPDDLRPVIAASDHLLEDIVLPSVYMIFQDKRFRERAHFQKLPVTEHDRIFNELHVAGICLSMFCLDVAQTIVEPESFHFWIKTREHLLEQAQKLLMEFGVNGDNAKLFHQLVDERFREYERLAKEAWTIWNEEEEHFRGMPEGLKLVTSRVDAISIGTTDHILRGKEDVGGQIARRLREWLLPLNEKIGKFIKRL